MIISCRILLSWQLFYTIYQQYTQKESAARLTKVIIDYFSMIGKKQENFSNTEKSRRYVEKAGELSICTNSTPVDGVIST